MTSPATSSTDNGNLDCEDIAMRLGELARELQNEDETAGVLEGIVHAAIELIPGISAGSISVVERRREVSSWAASAELPRQIDALQCELTTGPLPRCSL